MAFAKRINGSLPTRFSQCNGASPVCGWQYFVEETEDGDGFKKLGHFLVHEDTGASREIDWTPYGRMSILDIKRLVEMNFPPRPSVSTTSGGKVSSPWDHDTLELAYYRFITRHSRQPNHIPPGKAAPRFLDLRTGGNLPKDDGLPWIFLGTASAVVLLLLLTFTYLA